MRMFPLSIAIAGLAIFLAVHHLGQSIINYFDFVAFTMVFGGTLAVAVATFPWEYRKDLVTGIRSLFAKEDRRFQSVVGLCMKILREGTKNIEQLNLDRNSLYGRILLDGQSMIELSFNSERFEHILREKLFHSSKRSRRVANALRSLAKYPPAFGLVGTVLGLVNIMRGLNSGLDAKQTALEMSIALVATFYGLLVSNLLINPAGELILKKANEEEELGEIALQTLLLIKDNTSILEAQEILNSLIPEEQRYDDESQYQESAA